MREVEFLVWSVELIHLSGLPRHKLHARVKDHATYCGLATSGIRWTVLRGRTGVDESELCPECLRKLIERGHACVYDRPTATGGRQR